MTQKSQLYRRYTETSPPCPSSPFPHTPLFVTIVTLICLFFVYFHKNKQIYLLTPLLPSTLLPLPPLSITRLSLQSISWHLPHSFVWPHSLLLLWVGRDQLASVNGNLNFCFPQHLTVASNGEMNCLANALFCMNGGVFSEWILRSGIPRSTGKSHIGLLDNNTSPSCCYILPGTVWESACCGVDARAHSQALTYSVFSEHYEAWIQIILLKY